MTTIEMLLTGVLAMAAFALITVGVIGCVWVSWRTMPRKGQRKKSASNAGANERAIDERTFGDLLVRLWRNSENGTLWAGVTFLKVIASASFRTLGVYQLLRLPSAIIFACDRFLEQHWLPSSDQRAWILLREAMTAADTVIRSARKRRQEQVNGEMVEVDGPHLLQR